MKPKSSLRSFLALSGSAMLAVTSVSATQFWDGTATGIDNNWGTAANWGEDALPVWNDGSAGTGPTAIPINFGSLSSTAGTAFGSVVVPTKTTVYNDLTGISLEGITFGNNGTSNRTAAYTLEGNSITLGIATNNSITTTAIAAGGAPIEDLIKLDISFGTPGSAQNRVFNLGLNHDLKVESVISGGSSAILMKQGYGKLTLTNSGNTYLGPTNIASSTSGTGGSVLEITSIGNGGVVAGTTLGSSSNAAGNLLFSSGVNTANSNTLRYTGSTNGSTDRLFTLAGNFNGTNSMIESSGEGTLSFTNTGSIAHSHTNVGRNFYLGGTNAGDNVFNLVITNATGGTTNFTKQGVGKWILTNASTYNGTTTITGGKLSISTTGAINSTSGVTIGTASTAATTEFNYNSSTALSKAVSFAAGSTGGTLSGTGTINLAVNVTAGNTLAIGNSVGVMNFGENLEVAGTYLYELNNTLNTADLGDVAGNLTLGGILDLVQLGAYTAGDKFTLFAYDGTLSGLFKDTGGIINILDDTDFTDAGGVWRLNYNDTTAGLNGGVSASNTYVTITAIPEPRAALLGGLGLLALLRRRRN